MFCFCRLSPSLKSICYRLAQSQFVDKYIKHIIFRFGCSPSPLSACVPRVVVVCGCVCDFSTSSFSFLFVSFRPSSLLHVVCVFVVFLHSALPDECLSLRPLLVCVLYCTRVCGPRFARIDRENAWNLTLCCRSCAVFRSSL